MAVPRSEFCSCISDLQCRHEITLQATYFRQDLPRVVGSPNLRVLWLIRLPFNHRLLSQLRVSQLSSRELIILRHQRRTVSTSLRVSSISVSENNVIRGINGSLKFSNTSLCTCHNLLTPEALHILTNTNASVLVSVGVKPLTDLNFYFEAVCYASSQGLRNPYGLYISLCTLHLYCSSSKTLSATSATLDTGCWLDLTRQGLAPCKMHQD